MKNILIRFLVSTLIVILCFSFSNFLDVKAQEEDSWTTKEPIPMGSWDIVGINDKIYAIAGTGTYANMTYTNNAVLEFDPQNNTWTAKNPMPFSRNSFATAVYQNKIYVIGGLDGINQVYDPATDTWGTKTPMPTPRTQLNAQTVNGKIYLIGGQISGANPLDLNEVYDPINDSWATKAPIPTGVFAYGSAVVDNKIYFMGGSGPEPHDLNQIYDPATDTWSLGEPVPTPVKSVVAGATSGKWAPKKIYVIGGRTIDSALLGTNINQVYTPENDSWTVGASMPTARYQLHIAVVHDKLYVMGGLPYFNVEGVYCFENEEYTPIGYGTIPQPTPTPTSSPEPKPFPTTIAVASIAVIVVVGAGIIVYFKKCRRKV